MELCGRCLRQLVSLLPHAGNRADGRWCSAHVLLFVQSQTAAHVILPSQRRASCLLQPNPESPSQTHPWLITMVVPNSVKLTILINQWTVLGLNSEDISMFRSKFHVNYITSLFMFLKNNPQQPILVRLGQRRVPGFRLGLQSRLNGILITSSITIYVRICS